MTDKVVVLVTCGKQAEAERLARLLVETRLAACVNVLETPVRSTFRWQGSVQTVREHLVLIKTARRLLPALERAIETAHSYDVPEIIALPIAAGSHKYLAWLSDCLSPRSGGKRR